MDSQRFTVLGASGFVGSALTTSLRNDGHEVQAVGRVDLASLKGSLGHVVYCIGLTGDFRARSADTVEAHAGLLARLLAGVNCDSFLFLSSTRVYGSSHADEVVDEETPLVVRPDASAIYDLSKLLGESLVLAQDSPAYRVARLSNVVGDGMSPATFLGSLLRDLGASGRVEIGEAPSSSKDYVALSSVTKFLPLLAVDGKQRLYNVCSGVQTTHQQIAEALRTSGAGDVTFHPDGNERRFPTISAQRIHSEFGPGSESALSAIAALGANCAQERDTNEHEQPG